MIQLLAFLFKTSLCFILFLIGKLIPNKIFNKLGDYKKYFLCWVENKHSETWKNIVLVYGLILHNYFLYKIYNLKNLYNKVMSMNPRFIVSTLLILFVYLTLIIAFLYVLN